MGEVLARIHAEHGPIDLPPIERAKDLRPIAPLDLPQREFCRRSNGLLSIADLREITGYEHAGDVRRCLERQNIRFFFGKDGVWTTIDLVNAAAGLVHGASEPEFLPPEGFR